MSKIYPQNLELELEYSRLKAQISKKSDERKANARARSLRKNIKILREVLGEV